MVSLGSIGKSLVSKANEKRGKVMISPYNGNTQAFTYPFVLQYFPESLQDSLSVNYQVKEIPGAGGPLYQYINTGARTLSFTAVFTSDLDLGSEAGREGATDGKHHARNVDIRAAIAGLRYHMLPEYAHGVTFPPPKVLVTIINSGIGMAGGSTIGGKDSMFSIMTQCEVTWEAWFPSGHPRIATAALQFTQISQHTNGAVFFPKRDQDLINYAFGPGEGDTIPYQLPIDNAGFATIIKDVKGTK